MRVCIRAQIRTYLQQRRGEEHKLVLNSLHKPTGALC